MSDFFSWEDFEEFKGNFAPEDIAAKAESILKEHALEIAELMEWKANLLKAVEAQANDETIWTLDPSIGEAYMQQSLRWLHRVIEESDAEALRNILCQNTGKI